MFQMVLYKVIHRQQDQVVDYTCICENTFCGSNLKIRNENKFSVFPFAPFGITRRHDDITTNNKTIYKVYMIVLQLMQLQY